MSDFSSFTTATFGVDLPVLAGLRPSLVAYYTVVATALPVLLVAYVLNVNRMVKKSLGQRFLRSEEENARRLSTLIIAPLSQERFRRAAVGYMAPAFWLVVIIIVLCAAVVLPGFGEFEAVRALYLAKSAPFSRTLCMVGLLTAGVVAIAPLAWTTVRTIGIAVLFPSAGVGWAPGNALVVRWIYHGWKRGRFDAERWADGEFKYHCVDDGTIYDDRARAIEEITASAKRMANEGIKITNAKVIDPGGVLVAHTKTRSSDANIGRVEGSAMLFEFDGDKLKKVVRYEDWDHALAALERTQE
jgi:hypothetical protein